MLPLSPKRVVAVALLIVCSACGSGATAVERAALLSSKGNDPAAIEVLERHLSAEPDLDAHRMLIRLYGAVGDLGKAQDSAAKLSESLPKDSPIPWLELGHALELAHRYDDALQMYDRAADVAPNDPAGPRTGGMRAARWGEPELAQPRLTEALRRHPGDAGAWHALGLVRLHLGQLEAAKVAYEKGLQADPTALENRIGLATLAFERDRPSDALVQYDAVIAERPKLADAHLGRSLALILLARLDDAETALAEARRLGGDERVVARQARVIRGLRKRAGARKNP